ncbi:hypothetical protein [Natrarchaeobius oligotrophus]|uniref:Uncharacterized protein n=1 Tax=Natrarchaeobius chitinivorans TaxID=1679083 RepID=A0A3N6M8C9_NATCH|nr:hypothetical protein [Natrarchaeobius chitinivorans]RQG98587.1 hypothetical protein EA472_17450 [Natrarchaeobius chitinivorans]
MKRLGTILMAIVLVAALAAVPLGAATALADDSDDNSNDNADGIENNTVKPGEQLTGVVGVQDAEIDGEVSDRTFGIKIANAQSDEAKADIVGDRLDEIEERLDEHEAEFEEVEKARENGEISEGEYRAEIAKVTAENANTERAAEQAGETAGELPEDVLEERGINVEAIQELQEQANELGGPETTELAQSIAGENVGNGVAGDFEPGAPDEIPGDDATDASDDDDEDRGAGNNSADQGQ